MTRKAPNPPRGTGEAGAALWRAATAEFELDQHELLLLRECVRTADLLDELEERIKADGAVIESPHGTKAHPAAVEIRQQRVVLARLLAALRLPVGEESEGTDRRPQRRMGVRGPYGVVGGVA